MSIETLAPVVLAWFVSGGLYFSLSNQTRAILPAAVGIALSGMLSLAYLLADYFTGHGVDAAVWYHLTQGFKGAGVMDYLEPILGVSIALLAVLTFAMLLVHRARKAGRKSSLKGDRLGCSRRILPYVAHALLLFSLTAHPTVQDTFGLFFGSGSNPVDPVVFSKHLRPIRPASSGEGHKNIVYLYIESLERTFFDQERFPGLVSELRDLENKAVTFSGLQQAALTGWTVAGMTASQCGVPLTTFPWRDHSRDGQVRFSPGFSCIGDVLSDNGYILSYMGGADLSFAGKGRFYRSHGFARVKGLKQFVEQMPDVATSAWGIYDDLLLDSAYEEFVSLSQSAQPFGLFMLTLDTHQPSGHATPACRNLRYQDGSNEMLNAVACADKLVARFIRKILASPYARNTVLVVGSDHLALRNDASKYLEQNGGGDRRNLLMVFDPELSPRVVHKAGTTLDIAPTLLGLLSMKAGDFALGRDLLGESPTLVEDMGIDKLNVSLSHWRKSDLRTILGQ